MIDTLLERRRLTVGLALVLSLLGVLAWFFMPREEDPKLEERFGMILAPYPGADATSVERLVVEPLEEELAEVDGIKEVRATIRLGIAVLNVELRDDVGDIDTVWKDVDEAVDEATKELPEGALAPQVDHRLNETESVVIAVTGSSDSLVLADAADALRSRLLADPDVSRVVVTGDPGEQITVQWDDWQERQFGVGPLAIVELLQSRNITSPAGTIELDGRAVAIRPRADLGSLEEIRELPLVLRDGTGVRLGDITTVRRTTREPGEELARHDGRPAVLVGVIPRSGLDVVAFGDGVRAIVRSFEDGRGDVELVEVAYQPEKVEHRLSGLSRSLGIGIGIVALVLVVSMGLRVGLVVALAVPLVTFAAVAIYAAGGGVLHQIAVAALVLALGLLVDNAIVVAEAIQRRLDDGIEPTRAVRASVRELAIPLATATATTLAAFVPMLLSEGTSADFTRAIPIVVVITLAASYVYALVITPAVAGTVLRRNPRPGRGIIEPMAKWIARVSIRHPILVLVATAAIVSAEGYAAGRVGFSFFPASDREQMVVMVEMPEGTHIRETDRLTRSLEAEVSKLEGVTSLTTVVGRSAPSFYYNIVRAPSSPHIAQIIVTTEGPDDVGRAVESVRELARCCFPDARIFARRLEQGPPVSAPVEVRLYGDDLAELHEAATRVRGLVRDHPDTRDVRADDGLGVATLAMEVDDAEAARAGLSRRDVVVSLLGRTHGISAGSYRAGDDPVPIVVRGAAGESVSVDELAMADVAAPGGAPVPLSKLARTGIDTKPAVIHHRNRARTVSVLAEVAPDSTYAEIVGALVPRLEELDFGGVRWEIGGATEKSADANKGLAAKAPFGALLLIVVLLAEFNSFRRVGIIVATAPLAAMGIWPGLLLADLEFGFVALLGAIALIGIVVNAAIVLIDVADRRRTEGRPVAEALTDAIVLRTRPILLTTATTIAGLLPLGYSESTLWPPMAWSMISGLLTATVLSLFVVPSLYRLLVRDAR